MNKAIVTGATGLIASGVVEYLLDKNIQVIALGRSDIKASKIKHLSNRSNLKYLQLDMSEISSLPKLLEDICWKPDSDCVFYHFAWSGKNRLADGSVQDQFNNVTYSSTAVIVAKELACKKFINAGSQEERFIDRYLDSYWENQNYHSNMSIYGSAKVSARDMCLLMAYIKKIDYVHTRISVIIEESLQTKNYINSILKKILNQEKFDAPLNNQLFDFISKTECARLYYLIGNHGKNKHDYLLGSGNPMTLSKFFNEFSFKTNGKKIESLKVSESNNLILEKKDFSISDLTNVIGSKPSSINFNFINK